MVSLSHNWWLIVLRGVLAILFGLTAFFWPGVTGLVLILFFGGYAFADGVIAVITGLSHVKDSPRWWVFLIEGLISIGAGSVAFIYPGLAGLALLALIAAWAILTGIFEIAAAIRMRREITNEWLLALGGILSILAGALLIAQPVAGGLAVVWIIGAYALIFGVLLIALGFRLRNWDNSMHRPMIHLSP
jgi:uncharacterized membrane protein HdeD (DUF308 family)